MILNLIIKVPLTQQQAFLRVSLTGTHDVCIVYNHSFIPEYLTPPVVKILWKLLRFTVRDEGLVEALRHKPEGRGFDSR
jgi:hypothetical protein